MESPPLRRLLQHLPLLVLLLYFGTVFNGLIFLNQGVFERDGFYHARYAQLLPERGISRSFPWMQFTAWRDSFCDKDFLYHVLLAPFCSGSSEPLPGAKIATLVLCLGILGAAYAVLCRAKVPWPLFWVALLACGSGVFLNRMLMVRSHVLSVLLMVVAVPVILKQRFWPAFVLAFFYAWSYSFPLAVLMTAVAMQTGRLAVWLRYRRAISDFPKPKLGVLGGIGAGLLAGLIVNPYSPNTLQTQWLLLNISTARAAGERLELGREFQPMDFSDLWNILPGISLAFLFAALGGLLKNIEPCRRERAGEHSAMNAVLFAACGWFAGMFVYSRLVEYFAPFAVLAAAFVFRELAGDSSTFKLSLLSLRRRQIALAGLAAGIALVVHFHELSLRQIKAINIATVDSEFGKDFKAWWRGRLFDGAAQWMKANLPPGTVVVNFHWDDFPELFYSDPQRYYLVGLDPTLMRLSYPQETELLENMRTKRLPLDFAKLGEAFHAKYIIMRRYRAMEYPVLQRKEVQPVFEDELSVIYKIEPG